MRLRLPHWIIGPASDQSADPESSHAPDRPDDVGAHWLVPSTRACRGVQLMHVGQVLTCTSSSCPNPAGEHGVSFRCIVMASPCPTCGAGPWH